MLLLALVVTVWMKDLICISRNCDIVIGGIGCEHDEAVTLSVLVLVVVVVVVAVAVVVSVLHVLR